MATNALGEEQHPFWKPKFLQSAFAQLVSTVGLFSGHLDQGGWVTVTTLILSVYTAASVVENKLLKPTVTVTKATKNEVKVEQMEGSPA